jgi:hypothetical protein
VNIQLEHGNQVDLHTVRDAFGEACIGALLFPTEEVTLRTKRVPMESVRTTLRTCFSHWHTLPEEVQTDNESTLVTSCADGFPSLFSLWLQGLGIRHQTIRPGKPTDNAEVERCHRTVYEYALVGNEALSLPKLQHVLEQAIFELNFELPSWAEGCVQANRPSRLTLNSCRLIVPLNQNKNSLTLISREWMLIWPLLPGDVKSARTAKSVWVDIITITWSGEPLLKKKSSSVLILRIVLSCSLTQLHRIARSDVALLATWKLKSLPA